MGSFSNNSEFFIFAFLYNSINKNSFLSLNKDVSDICLKVNS